MDSWRPGVEKLHFGFDGLGLPVSCRWRRSHMPLMIHLAVSMVMVEPGPDLLTLCVFALAVEPFGGRSAFWGNLLG